MLRQQAGGHIEEDVFFMERVRTAAEALADIAGTSSTSVLQNALEKVFRRILAFDTFILFVYDPDTQSLRSADDSDTTIPVSGTRWEQIVRERQPFLSGTNEADQHAAGAGLQSVIDVPVQSHDKLLGLLHFSNIESPPFTEIDLKVVEVIASLTAFTLVNMRVTEEYRKAENEAQHLAHFGNWTWKVGTGSVTWSDEMFRIYGLEPAGEISFDAFIELVHPDDRARMLEIIENARQDARPFDFHHRIVRPDGVTRLLHARGDVVVGTDGQVQRIFGTGQDITDQKETEQALLASEASYRAIFELSSDAIFVHDIDTGAILDANRKACELHGCTLEELKSIGIGGISFGAPPYDDAHAREYIRRAAMGEPQRFEWLIRNGEGDPVWVEVSLHRVNIVGQERILASVRNISERKAVEEDLQKAHSDLELRVQTRTAELAQAEQRFRAIVEASPTPLLLSRIEDGVVLYANERLEQFIGAEPGSLVGKRTPDFYYDIADRPMVIQTIREQGYVRDMEVRLKKLDGTPRWVSLTVQRLIFNGEPAIAAALTDITERKQTEEALRHRTDELEAIFHALPDLYFRLASDGTILDYRAGRSFSLFVPPEEFLGKKVQDVLPQPVSQQIENAFEEIKRTGGLVTFEYMLAKDGEPHEFESRMMPLPDGQVVAVVRDITEKKRGEKALRASEASYRDLFDSLTELVYIQDLEGHFVNVNEVVLKAYGYTREELIGKTPDILAAPGRVNLEKSWEQFQLAVAGETQRFDWWGLRKDGTIFPKEVVLNRSTYFGQDVVIAIARDITERKRSEEALRLQKTLLEAQGEASIDGILVISEEGKILSYNKRFVEMWELPSEVIDTRSDEDALHAVLDKLEDPQAFLDRVSYLYAHPYDVARDEISLRDGRVFDRYSAPVVSQEGDFYGRIWFFRDITAQKRHAEELEQARRDAERAREQANRYADSLKRSLEELRATQMHLVQQEKMASLGQLTAGIAHEIKNPLNFVNNFAMLSRELIDELRNELTLNPDLHLSEVVDLLDDLAVNTEKIELHGRRADGIVRSMLDHSRGTKGSRQPTDLNSLVEEYVNLAYHGMRAHSPTANVEIERDYDETVGDADVIPQEFGRVLVNLLNNAFYAVMERTLQDDPEYKPRVKIATRREKESITITVDDNGTGIPEEVRAKIFEPFFTTKPPGEGTGLGLSLAYDIVTQGHGGTLSVESKENKGSTFIINIPDLSLS